MKFRVITIPIKKLVHYEFNPKARTEQLALRQLKEDIKKSNIISPLFVKIDGDCYKVIDGNRRLAIAKSLGIKEVQCLISDDTTRLDEDDTFVLLNKQRALSGNEQLEFALNTNKFINDRFKQNYNYLFNLGGAELLTKCLQNRQNPNSIAPSVIKASQVLNNFNKEYMLKIALWLIENKQTYKFRVWGEFSSDLNVLKKCIENNEKLPNYSKY